MGLESACYLPVNNETKHKIKNKYIIRKLEKVYSSSKMFQPSDVTLFVNSVWIDTGNSHYLLKICLPIYTLKIVEACACNN